MFTPPGRPAARARRAPAGPALACLAAAVALALAFALPQEAFGLVAQTPLPGKSIPKFVEPLPVPGILDMTAGGAMTVTMTEFQQPILPAAFYAALPAPAPGAPDFRLGAFVWGYNGTYPGPTVEARRGRPVLAKYVNALVAPRLYDYLAVDQTLHWADPYGMMMNMPMWAYTGPVPTATHLHGGEVRSDSDGHPDSWFTPGYAITGPGFMTSLLTYPNTQEAATLWYHDHALGMTRLNVYGGLAGFYLLRDPLNEPANLPGNPVTDARAYEREIAIQDRMFDTNGQLYFPSLGLNPMIHPFWNPEFLGDAIVVNGKTWPVFNAEPRRYRLRLLNGSNARFYELFFVNPATKAMGPALWQIGSDGGLLNAPVAIDPNNPATPMRLLLAPGERADVIVDFTPLAGQTLILRNTGRSPYPKGAPPDGATTGQILKVVVGTAVTVPDRTLDPAATVSLRPPGQAIPPLPATVTPATPVRTLTLNEVMAMLGPQEILLNNTKWDGALSPGAGGVTEMPRVGSTEVWEIVNLTADTHPIHLHLVQFQLASRQAFDAKKYGAAYALAFTGGASPVDGLIYPPGAYIPGWGPPPGGNPSPLAFLRGPVRPPDANETGWKDTFKVHPGEVTRLVVRFAPTDAAAPAPGVNSFAFDPGYGPGYVWHCHIIDHEDNEMMRPYLVTP